MKLLSLNLWNGGRLFEQAQQFLVEQQADIYFLQEAYDGHGEIEQRFRTVEILQQSFTEYFVYFAPVYVDTRQQEGLIEDGQLLLSRWPLKNKKNIFLDLPYGKYDQDGTTDFSNFPATIQKAEIQLEEKVITLMNVHGPVNFQGTEDSVRRLRMRDLILAELTEHTIVAGDFNVQPETQTIKGLEQKLVNVFKGQQLTTFNVARKNLKTHPGYATAVVDMMFLSPSFTIKKTESPQVDVSDHLPLVAEVDLD